MFLEKIIPSAYAQGIATQVKSTAVAGGQAVEEAGKSGIQELFSFIVRNLDNWIGGIVIIVISWIIAKIVAGGIKNKIIEKKGEEIHESALVLVERITKTVILIVGITVAAAINGFNFTAVIGALSLGIGFALKDIIGTFISSIILLSQDRIKIGDLVQVGDILGTIISIDTRVTVLQAIDGTEVVVPNQEMLNQTLVSYTTNPFRRIELIVGVDYNTDLPMVTSLIKGIIEKDPDIVSKPESLVLVDEFSDSSINIKVLFWIESTNNWMKVRSNLANRIKKTFNELNINIPFPIRTLKLDEDDRSFLKTMDSMKKGYVPERKTAPPKEKVIEAALGTENAPQIPEKIFGAPEKMSRTDSPATAQKPAPAPAPMHPAAPAKAQPEEPATPPPTHL
ncbi:mechanosensitive ion channel family protein [Candidatus Peregrinibacteria bacterium]|nr:mechanosensitive ion channel family protein [Candidatus Peregrinibacteria bacterium]